MGEGLHIAVAGARLIADPAGALFWPERRMLIVSDLHLEKGTALGPRGVFLPPYDTRSTLRRLLAACRAYAPEIVLSLGDAFHDAGAAARMDAGDAATLAALSAAHRFIWVLGNHDPAPQTRFAGETHTEYRVGPLVFRHEPAPGASPGEIAGHLHPCARVLAEGRSLRRRCFAADGARLVMPAFGAFAGGLNILDEAFASLFERPSAYLLGARGVYPAARASLLADPAPAARLQSV